MPSAFRTVICVVCLLIIQLPLPAAITISHELSSDNSGILQDGTPDLEFGSHALVDQRSDTPTAVTGQLTGQITDAQGALIPGVRIMLFASDGKLVAQTITDESGRYILSNLQPGEYMLAVESPGFTAQRRTVQVTPSSSQTQDLVIGPAAPVPHPSCFSCALSKLASIFTLGAVATTAKISLPAGTDNNFIPVYNALISPSTRQDDLTHIIGGKESVLTFYIGQLESSNTISAPLWTVNPKLLQSQGKVPLIISMTCPACSTTKSQQRVIIYSSDHKSSTKAQFPFTTDRLLTDDGKTRLFVKVDSGSGESFDQFAIDLIVDTQEGSISGIGEKPISLARFESPAPQLNPPDVLITLSQNQGVFNVTLMPTNPDLARSFQNKHLDHGEPRVFNSGTLTVGEMRSVSQDAAIQLKAITDQDDVALQKLLALQGSTASPLIVDPSTLKMSAEDKRRVLRQFYLLGSFIYLRLFQDPDPDLAFIIDQLERFSLPTRAVRVAIRTVDVSFPWQVLHIPEKMQASTPTEIDQTVDENGFWGIRFNLTVESSTLGSSGVTPSTVPNTPVTSAIFGAYHPPSGALSADIAVGRFAHQQADKAKSNIKLSQLIVDESKTDLLGHLKQHRQDLAFLAIFAHGQSGWIIVDLSGQLTLQELAIGPTIMLGPSDVLKARDISQLPNDIGVLSGAFFSLHPIVLLNACETGTVNAGTFNGLTLPIALLNVGAAGVVATESPVWSPFAYAFGNDLIGKIAEGNDISTALLELRRSYLKTLNNPFGLLYSYYGRATALQQISASPN
jgi:hypothetical protein